MIACFVCGTQLDDDAKACSVCGTSLAPVSAGDEPISLELVPIAGAPVEEALGNRRCPVCNERYTAVYSDSFCTCGAALVADTAELPSLLEEREPEPQTQSDGPRLVVFSDDLKPIHTLLLDRDVTRIGRNDPVRGDFVDLDVGRFLEPALARKVSRKHALILRSRETQTFTLRPLARNTGTQIGNELAAELQDYPLSDGTRIILGGTVRLKFQTS